MIDSSGIDATRQFEDVGHSGEAREELAKLRIGVLREATTEELEEERLRKIRMGEKMTDKGMGGWGKVVLKWTLPIVLLGLAYLIRKYT